MDTNGNTPTETATNPGQAGLESGFLYAIVQVPVQTPSPSEVKVLIMDIRAITKYGKLIAHALEINQRVLIVDGSTIVGQATRVSTNAEIEFAVTALKLAGLIDDTEVKTALGNANLNELRHRLS